MLDKEDPLLFLKAQFGITVHDIVSNALNQHGIKSDDVCLEVELNSTGDGEPSVIIRLHGDNDFLYKKVERYIRDRLRQHNEPQASEKIHIRPWGE